MHAHPSHRPPLPPFRHLLPFLTVQAGTASGTYCDPFSILADLCVDMPGMNGCQGWVALCSASGTKVAQCTQREYSGRVCVCVCVCLRRGRDS